MSPKRTMSNESWLWSARVAWVVLPFTAGIAYADVFDHWSRASTAVATIMLWAAWFAGAVALLAPRPWGFAVLRVVAPTAVATVALADAPVATRAVGIGVAVVA